MKRKPKAPGHLGWHVETDDEPPFNWRVVRPDDSRLDASFASITEAHDALDEQAPVWVPPPRIMRQLDLFGGAP